MTNYALATCGWSLRPEGTSPFGCRWSTQPAIFHLHCRIAAVDTAWRGIGEQRCAGAEHGTVPHPHPRADESFRRHPATIADVDRAKHQLEVSVCDVMAAGAQVGALGDDRPRAYGNLALVVDTHAWANQRMIAQLEVAGIPDR